LIDEGTGMVTHTRAWNGEGRLKSVRNGSYTINLVYYALGQQVQQDAGGLAQTVAVNGLRSRGATGCQDVEARGIEDHDKDKSLREIADPTNQGSAPAGVATG
jgi:hypothetical protein